MLAREIKSIRRAQSWEQSWELIADLREMLGIDLGTDFPYSQQDQGVSAAQITVGS